MAVVGILSPALRACPHLEIFLAPWGLPLT